MKTRYEPQYYLRRVALGILISLIIVALFFTYNRNEIVGQMLLYEIMPNYKIESDIKTLLKLEPMPPIENIEPVFSMDTVDKTENENSQGEPSDIIQLSDGIYEQAHENKAAPEQFNTEILTLQDIDKFTEISDLKSKFYIVDKRTDITTEDFNVHDFLNTDLKIETQTTGPKILIFHTHSTETYANSMDESEGVLGLGEKLCSLLYEKYNIETLHDTSRYDIVDGKSQILGAYERMEANVTKILAENPSIEIAIDLHRDGVSENTHLVSQVNNQDTAQIMFFNGLSKIYKDGVLMSIDSLPNPNLKTNLSMSFQMQLAANTLYPNFTRKVYLNAYRYSLHMVPKSMLIEVGAQTNTKEEAFNAMEPLADILASVIL